MIGRNVAVAFVIAARASTHSSIAVSLMLWVGASVYADDRLAEAEFLVESLRTWERQAAIYCEFRVEDGLVNSADTNAIVNDRVPFATGVLVKSAGELDANYRYELYHANANIRSPGFDPKQPGLVRFRNRNHAEILGREVGITFDPHSRYVIMRSISRPEDAQLRGQLRVTREFGPFNPVNPKEGMLGCIELYLRNAIRGTTSYSKISYEVTHPNADHADLQFHEVWPRLGNTLNYRFRFRTNVPLPYIDYVEEEGLANGVRQEMRVYLTSFVNSPIPIARRVVRVRLKYDNSEPPYQCRVWSSEDMGERQPQESDFALQIPAKAIYGGFKKTMDPSRSQTLTLAQFTAADGMHHGETGTIQSVAMPAAVPGWSAWILAGAVALTIFMVGAALVVYRRRVDWG